MAFGASELTGLLNEASGARSFAQTVSKLTSQGDFNAAAPTNVRTFDSLPTGAQLYAQSTSTPSLVPQVAAPAFQSYANQ